MGAMVDRADALVIGAGASGEIADRYLAEAGLMDLAAEMIERGPIYGPTPGAPE